MRPVSGDDLVTAALQSSLARAQKNYKFNHQKQFGKGNGGVFGFGKSAKFRNKEEEELPIFSPNKSVNRGNGKGLRFQSEFDLWREQASEFTFVSEGYTNGAGVPDDIECLNVTSVSRGNKSGSKSDRNSVPVPRFSLLQNKNNRISAAEASNSTKHEDKSGKGSSVTTTENSFELLKKLKENRKEKKKFAKLRKKLLKGGFCQEETEKLIDQAKVSNSGVGAILHKLRNAVSADKAQGVENSTVLKQQLNGKAKKKDFNKMKDMSENGDSATSTQRPRPNTPSQHQSASSTASPSSMNGGSSSGSGHGHSQLQLPQPKRILYPRDKITPGYIEKLPVGAGFFNMGNSCYLNASLQAVFHVPAFINWLRSDAEHRKNCQDNGNCIICAMKKTLDSAMTRQNVSAIRPVEIINRLRSICRHFSHGRQEDAHEFLRYLFESMEKSYLAAINCLRIDNRSKETNPLGQIFGGYIRTEVTCLKCHYVSTTFQPTAELQLDIRHVTTLEDAIANHFKKERLDNNDYKCEKCRTISQATKQFSLETPPIVLCLQLKRFTLYGTKIAKRIHCNQYLDMSRFIHKSKQVNGFAVMKQKIITYLKYKIQIITDDDKLAPDQLCWLLFKTGLNKIELNFRYRLVALVTHLGSSPNCGHYTAIAQAANGNFYQFDDTFVHQVTISNALNNDAYVIIYELDKSKKSPESSPKIASSSASGYPGPGNKVGYPSSTASSSNSGSINVLFPKKLPSTPIPKIATANQTSKLVQNAENEMKPRGLSGTESMSAGSPNGRTLNNGELKPGGVGENRKMISFGIRPTGVHGTNKINILKSGVPLTNSSKLVPTGSNSSSSVRSENKSDQQIKLVPYNDDENEESDKDENARGPPSSGSKRLNSPENHKKQSPKRSTSELSASTPPKSPKHSSSQGSGTTTQSSSSLGTNFKKDQQTTSTSDKLPSKSAESSNTQTKDSNKRKSPENDEASPRKPRSHKRRSSSSSSSSSERGSSERGNNSSSSQNKRKRDEEAPRSSSEKKITSNHSSSDHNNHRRDHRDSYSQERERERKRNRNPSRSRSRSPSADQRDKRGSSSGPRMSINNSNGGGPVDVSTLKQDNPILSWSGQKSVLSKSMDDDRKRSNDKSLDEEYDDEFDQGRTKKVRRSRSLPRETESGGMGNKFQTIEDRKKQVEQWTSLMGGNGTGLLRRNSGGASVGGNGNATESRSWLNNGDNEDPTRFKRNFPPRTNFNNGNNNNGPRPRHSSSNGSHSSSNYSLNSHGRSPFRNGHHSGSNGGGGGHYRSQSQNSYHHSGNKFWGGDRNRH